MEKGVILQFTCMHSTKYGAVESYFKETVAFCGDHEYKSVLQYQSKPQSKTYVRDISKLNAEILVDDIPLDAIGAFIGVWRVISKVKPEIIHVHFAERFVKLWIPIIARMHGVRHVIHSIHNIPEYEGKVPARFIYNWYAKLLAVSKSAEEGCIKGGVDAHRVVTHYLGLFGERTNSHDLRQKYRAELGIPKDAVALAIIAFDTPFKGIDILLEAFAKARAQTDNIHLIQIGVDPKASELPALAEELGISKYVHWAGIRDAGWRVLNAADIYLQTSRFSEGLGLSIVEAMALRLPVIGTNIGGIPEAVEDGVTGLIVEPNADDISKAIVALLADPNQWKVMGDAGYTRYQELFNGPKSVENQVVQYYDLANLSK